jgi:NMD protein affecting ribosome stability and mRNA decay
MKKKRHDHRQSLWIIGIGAGQLTWCYRCGAIHDGQKWTRPTGPDGENPAMADYRRALKKEKHAESR